MIDEKRFAMWDACGVGSRLPSQALNAVPSLEPTGLRRFAEQLNRSQRERIRTYLNRDPHEVMSLRRSELPEGATVIPLQLGALPDTCHFTYAWGNVDLLRTASVAIVGTRHANAETRALTNLAVKKFAGATIISGGALGTDRYAHEFALDNDQPTIVVAPSGLANLTPKSNAALFERVLRNDGLVISEYAPDASPRSYHFHRRNQVIAAMTDRVVVVRAKVDSGTMITANAAISFGRRLFAIPGSPLDPYAVAPNLLIQKGLAESLHDLQPDCSHPTTLDAFDASVMGHLPCTLAELEERLSAPTPKILSAITELRLRKIVDEDPMTGELRVRGATNK